MYNYMAKALILTIPSSLLVIAYVPYELQHLAAVSAGFIGGIILYFWNRN